MSPSDPHPSENGHRRGRRIEDRLLSDLRSARDSGAITDFFQPDACVIANGELFFVEAKGQDRFEPPPFEGHGLPVDQIQRYEHARQVSGCRTVLRIYEDDGPPLIAFLDELENGPKIDTAGTIKTPRRIYHIDSYEKAGQAA